MNPTKTILLTGAGGFLGRRLLEAWSCHEHYRIVDIPSRDGFAEKVEAAFRSGPKIDVVLHAGFTVDFSAGVEGEDSDNVRNTALLLEMAEKYGAGRFVFLSGAAVMGVSAGPRARNEAEFGTTDAGFSLYRNCRYVRDKIACQHLVRRARIPTATFFLTTVVDDTGKTAVGLAGRLARWSPLIVCPPGGSSFLSFRKLEQCLASAIDADVNGEYILSSGNAPFWKLMLGGRPRRWWQVVWPLPLPVMRWLTEICRWGLPLLPPASILESTSGFKYYSSTRFDRGLAAARAPVSLRSAS